MTLEQVREWQAGKERMHVGYQRWAVSINEQEVRAFRAAIDDGIKADEGAEKCFCDRTYPGSNPEASCGDCPTRDYKAAQPTKLEVAVRIVANKCATDESAWAAWLELFAALQENAK